MRVTIDGAGRVVVPKHLRDLLGLQGGEELDVSVREGKLELTPVPTEMKLERRGRGWVAVPDRPLPSIDADDVRAVIETVRR